MILGALVDAGVPLAEIQRIVDSLGLPPCPLEAKEVRKVGFRATQVVVHAPEERRHRHLHHILEMIDRAALSSRAKDWAKRIFTRLGEAEAKVHGVPLEKVHFHEVGAADSIVDIVGSVFALDYLGVDRVFASAIPTGTGTIRIAHGEVAVPAPATAELLRGVPILPCEVAMEMTTPTGAAFITTLAASFGSFPAMKVEKIGYGAGSRDVPNRANVLRFFLGEGVGPERQSPGLQSERVWVLQANFDDLSGEVLGYVLERLWEHGVLDLFTTPVHMKKNRPGVELTVLCTEDRFDNVERILFEETTTLGVRFWPVERHILSRESAAVTTPWGPVQGKLRRLPSGESEFSPEFEACREVARRSGVALRKVFEAAEAAFREQEATHRDCQSGRSGSQAPTSSGGR